MKITPYKGGRTEQIRARLTPEAKATLIAIAKRCKVTQADVLDALLSVDIDELVSYVDKLTDYGANEPTG